MESLSRKPGSLVTKPADFDLESEIDRIYQLPLEEFIPARKQLATKLRAFGERVTAARVQSLAKPLVSTWAVNQAFWSHRMDFEDMIRKADRLREIQRGAVTATPDDLRDAMADRRLSVSRVVTHCVASLSAAGYSESNSTIQKIQADVDALAIWGSGFEGPRWGRLTRGTAPPGFDALSGLAARGALPVFDAFAKPKTPAKAREEAGDESRARAVLSEREGQLNLRRSEVERAQEDRDQASRKAEVARQSVLDALHHLEKVKKRSEEADTLFRKARSALRSAKKAVREAERDVAQAQSGVERTGTASEPS